jgi:hypothetical protein
MRAQPARGKRRSFFARVRRRAKVLSTTRSEEPQARLHMIALCKEGYVQNEEPLDTELL